MSSAAVGDDQKLGQGELAFTQDPQPAGEGLAWIAVGNPGRRQAVKTGLTEGFQLFDPFHHQREKWREQVLEIVADEKILLARAADHGGRVDCLVAMVEVGDLKDRVIMFQ